MQYIWLGNTTYNCHFTAITKAFRPGFCKTQLDYLKENQIYPYIKNFVMLIFKWPHYASHCYSRGKYRFCFFHYTFVMVDCKKLSATKSAIFNKASAFLRLPAPIVLNCEHWEYLHPYNSCHTCLGHWNFNLSRTVNIVDHFCTAISFCSHANADSFHKPDVCQTS